MLFSQQRQIYSKNAFKTQNLLEQIKSKSMFYTLKPAEQVNHLLSHEDCMRIVTKIKNVNIS